MNTIDLYQTSDSQTFDCEDKALKHQVDLLGELLDGFLPHDDRGNVTQCDRHNLLIKQLKNPRIMSNIKQLSLMVDYMADMNIKSEDVNKVALRWSK